MNAKSIYFIVLLSCSFIGRATLGVAGETGTEASTEPSTAKQDAPNVKKDTSDRVGALNEKQINQLALSKEVKSKEVTWLDVNYAGEGISKVLALTEKPKIPDAQGAVLLLHDKGQHADWPYLIRPLRKYLPESGWFTLALSLPYENERKVPERSLSGKKSDSANLTDAMRLKLQFNSSGERKKEPSVKVPVKKDPLTKSNKDASTNETAQENEAPVDINLTEKQKAKSTLTDEAKAEFNIQAAIDYIHQQGYQNIIIVTYGTSANLALNHIKDMASQISSKGFALVMVDPILKTEYQDDLESVLGKGFKAPILDIVNSVDLDGKTRAIERKASAVVAKAKQYMQLNLIASQQATSQLALLRRIRFWIERYAPGMSATAVY